MMLLAGRIDSTYVVGPKYTGACIGVAEVKDVRPRKYCIYYWRLSPDKLGILEVCLRGGSQEEILIEIHQRHNTMPNIPYEEVSSTAVRQRETDASKNLRG